MAGKRCLVVSVGTGVNETGAESVANAIVLSVNHFAADKVLFVITKQSAKTVLPIVVGKTGNDYEVCEIDDPDDINLIFKKLEPLFQKFRRQYHELIVDYTSGTKSMTGALCVLGSLYEANSLSYVTGERNRGIVVKGTEKHLSINPYYITISRRFTEAISMFNKCQFEACITILSRITDETPLPEIVRKVIDLKFSAEAYSLWDRFEHNNAFVKVKSVVNPALNNNKAFLGKLTSSPDKEKFLIADLLNNASRRGDLEQKYDDAVARLYRTIEFIAQYRLKKYGITATDNVLRKQIPPEFQKEFIFQNDKTQLALKNAWRLLDILGDKLGHNIPADKKLQNVLRKRNYSILAHGFEPVIKQDYRDLFEKVKEIAKEAVPDLDNLMIEASFTKWIDDNP